MNAYDFTTLNDKEFEALAADLLSAEYRVKVERFKPGRDAGVDGRWFSDTGGEIIIQCKHWARSGYDRLIKHLRESEHAKINRLSPSRYILVTSVPLSRKNKSEIARVLGPWILREDDVIGPEDLNRMLAQHSEVERRNFKLWLSSSNALGHILNNAILGRSRAEVELMRDEAALYVATQDHVKAWTHLEEHRVLIVTGEPGIGKTTLARQLALEYVAQGFEFVMIEESISEAEAVYSDAGKQIFYFDDFLGRTFLEALKTREDSHIATFMRRVAKDAGKRFVLTSRTNILNQGAVLSDLYSEGRIVRNTYTLEVGNLNNFDRARILYNHIWHSDLSDDYINELYAERRYHAVIQHDNFNPRLIAFILDSDKVSARPASSYWRYVQTTMRNPSDVWSHFFVSQMNQDSRDLVYLTVLNGKHIKEDVLRDAFAQIPPRSQISQGQVHHNFLVAMRHAVGSVLNRGVGSRDHEVTYSLFNPSIADYVLRHLSGSKLWEAYYPHLRTLAALSQIQQMRRQAFFGDGAYRIVIRTIARREVESELAKDEYSLRLATLLVDEPEFRQEFTGFLAGWLLAPPASVIWRNLDEYIAVLLKWRDIIDRSEFTRCAKRLPEMFNDAALPLDEPELISSLLAELSYGDVQDVHDEIRERIIETWGENIDDVIRDEELLSGYFHPRDVLDAESNLQHAVTTHLSDLGIELTADELADLCARVDLETVLERNRSAHERNEGVIESWRDRESEKADDATSIDDLFERNGR